MGADQRPGRRTRVKGRGDGTPTPSISQLWAEIRQLKNTVEQMRPTLAKLKRILQVDDNWHSRVSQWIGELVSCRLSGESERVQGKLLWTDRYNIALEVNGREEIFNKGHIVRIRAVG